MKQEPRKTLLVTLVLAAAGCSFDARGLGQSGEPGETSPSTGGPGSTTGAGEAGPTSGSETTAGPAGEASATGETGPGDSTGPVDPVTSTTGDPTTPDPSTGTTTGTTGGESTGGETSSSTGPCAEKTYYLDEDGDGFGKTSAATMACAPPEDHVEKPGDCDDEDAMIGPAIEEACNAVDDDCDDEVDEYNPPINVECGGCEMVLYQPNNRVYHFCAAERKWSEAKGDCEARNATLATDLDDAHHAWLLDQMPGNSGPWYLGGAAPNKDEKFVWLDGSPVPDPDDRWGFDRPGGGNGTNRLALVSNGNAVGFWLAYNGKWFDRGDDEAEPFICESEFVP